MSATCSSTLTSKLNELNLFVKLKLFCACCSVQLACSSGSAANCALSDESRYTCAACCGLRLLDIELARDRHTSNTFLQGGAWEGVEIRVIFWENIVSSSFITNWSHHWHARSFSGLLKDAQPFVGTHRYRFFLGSARCTFSDDRKIGKNFERILEASQKF